MEGNKTIDLVTFSPTHSSLKLGRSLAVRLGQLNQVYDTTTNKNPLIQRWSQGDLVLFSFPVYAGRVPSPFLERLGKLEGNGANVVILAVYGNRHYDDSLLEMGDFLREHGFHVVAGAAFLARHSYSEKIAGDRPNSADFIAIGDFAQRIDEKLKKALEPVELPGNRPYRDGMSPSQWAPDTDSRCIQCGICVVSCPMQIISPLDPAHIEPIDQCLHCFACVRNCPQGAKLVDREDFEEIVSKMINSFGQDEKTPELFL
ncbi:MAG: 4Fe-4S dicluster domain-containing protein [Tissierellia bacterium]|nr:4Fe-4S dicluster domain-containing protein [Tissierellia bacterium]